MKAILLSLCLCLAAQAQFPYPPVLADAKTEVYKTVGDVKLNLYVFEPAGHRESDKTAAIVFFFGGGWTNGSPAQFERQCKYLALRGMVAITADYRVFSRNKTQVPDAVRDAKSAIRYVRRNAARLGIDPDRIAAGGGSAGGHLAAAAGVIPGMEEPGEDSRISSRPNALVLFNPAVIVGDRTDSVLGGIAAKTISPIEHVTKGAPPTIIFHGKADTTVPYETEMAFTSRMVAAGNRCTLVGYEGQVHGFFNYGRNDNKYYTETLREADKFLVSLRFLTGFPTI
jgi:acetyl esterase/lipase